VATDGTRVGTSILPLDLRILEVHSGETWRGPRAITGETEIVVAAPAIR
jgi:hypothetical protein